MKKLLTATSIVVLAAACTPEPLPVLCDRDAIEWDKWGTVELPPECMPTVQPTINLPVVEDTPDDEDTPDPVDDPVVPDTPDNPDEPDTSKVKGNNGWGNGDQPAPGRSRDRNNAENSDREQLNHGQGRRN